MSIINIQQQRPPFHSALPLHNHLAHQRSTATMDSTSSLDVPEKIFVMACFLALKGAAAAVSAPLTFISNERLTVKLGSYGLQRFNRRGLLELTVANLKYGNFKIKIENKGSPNINFQPNTSISIGIFSEKSILGLKGLDPSFPAGKTRPLHWSLKTKDESNVPIKINCGTSVVGEQTKVQIVYEAFELFDLENVQISDPIKAGKAEIQKPIIGEGRGMTQGSPKNTPKYISLC